MELSGRRGAYRLAWLRAVGPLAALTVLLCAAGCSSSESEPTGGPWNPKTAASYLDHRLNWWMHWSGAQRDHGTFCVSCHTAVPYALARARLRPLLGETGAESPESRLLANVTQRVRLWAQTSPFYSDREYGPGKSAQSRGTEAVLNALILAARDAHVGRLSSDTQSAFDHMWALQRSAGEDAGSWAWLDFNLAPWEAADTDYYGAALAAIAVGSAPEHYATTPAIQEHMRLLRDYLQRTYPTHSLHEHLLLLWAATELPGLIEPSRREEIVASTLRVQNVDGGWSLYTLYRGARKTDTLRALQSDGYATGLVSLVLQRAGVNGEAMQRALSWLDNGQRQMLGSWVTYSLNKRRDPSSPIGRFMSDAATAYAVLALTHRP